MEYISENHSKHLLICHLIFVCKYRKKLLLKVGDDIKTEIESIANHYGWQIIEQEIDQDHIHILIRYSPKWSILEIVRLLKQLTTYRMWQKHNKYLSSAFLERTNLLEWWIFFLQYWKCKQRDYPKIYSRTRSLGLTSPSLKA